MKYIKILGLLVVAATGIMTFAAIASATTVTGPGGVTTPTIHAENEGEVVLHTALGPIKCQSTIEAKVETHGSGVTAEGNVSVLNFFNCTEEWVVDLINPGRLIIHYTSGSNGTLTSTAAKITGTRAGLSCIYETNATHIGTITGEVGVANGQGTLDISGSIPRVGGSFLCGGSTATLTGAYLTTQTLKVDP